MQATVKPKESKPSFYRVFLLKSFFKILVPDDATFYQENGKALKIIE